MNIFLDANTILDLIDIDRANLENTKELLRKYLIDGATLYTSCDIFTTVYYVASKKIDFKIVTKELEKILTFVNIVPIDINIINKAIAISKEKNHKDLEDILQYVCAKESSCEVIVTNDKSFYNDGIKLIGTK